MISTIQGTRVATTELGRLCYIMFDCLRPATEGFLLLLLLFFLDKSNNRDDEETTPKLNSVIPWDRYVKRSVTFSDLV